MVSDFKPITLRFDVVNLFDKTYELRDGSGIGVFAPQFGARRGFFRRHFTEALIQPEPTRCSGGQCRADVAPDRYEPGASSFSACCRC